MLPILWLLFLTSTAWGYRVFEYVGRRCTGEKLDTHRLAGPSACTKLDVGVTSAVLVKIDNVNDNQYNVVVYDTDDCSGSIVGSIANANGCLDLYAFPEHVGKSVKVIPKQGLEKRESTSQGFDTGSLYNYEATDRPGEIMVPVMHAGFHAVNTSDHSDDGTYLNEAIEEYYSSTVEHVEEIEDVWRNGPKRAKSTTAMTSLNERAFNRANCRFSTLCQAAVQLGEVVFTEIDYAGAVRAIMKSIPWKNFAKGIFFATDQTSNGVTIGTFIQSYGKQDTSCDTVKTSGGLAQDLLDSLGPNVTNANFRVYDEDGNAFGVAVYAFPKGETNANNNNCGHCAHCL